MTCKDALTGTATANGKPCSCHKNRLCHPQVAFLDIAILLRSIRPRILIMLSGFPCNLALAHELMPSRRGNLRRALSFLAVGGFVLTTIMPSLVRAQTVTATVAVGKNPTAFAVNAVTNT